MNRVVFFAFSCLLLTDDVLGQVRLLNDSDTFVSVELRGRGDTDYRGPWKISPRAIATIPVAAGDYRVRLQRTDGRGKRQVLPFRDYSDCSITYHVSLCTICAPVSKTEIRSQPVSVETVFLADRLFRPKFSRGSFRLGVAVVDDPKGAKVTAVEVGSPAYEMRRVGEEDDKLYWLQERNSIITHVNGVRIQTAAEFDEAMANSPRESTFTVFSTTRQTAIEYRTQIRD